MSWERDESWEGKEPERDLEGMLMAVTCCLESSQLMPCHWQYDFEGDHPGGLGERELMSFDIASPSSPAAKEIITRRRRRWVAMAATLNESRCGWVGMESLTASPLKYSLSFHRTQIQLHFIAFHRSFFFHHFDFSQEYHNFINPA